LNTQQRIALGPLQGAQAGGFCNAARRCSLVEARILMQDITVSVVHSG